MSKSEADKHSRITITDSPDEIRSKLRKSVSDFTSEVTYDPVNRPGISNLVDIHAAFLDYTPEEIVEQNSHLDTLGYKLAVADVIIEELSPIRTRFNQLMDDKESLEAVLVRNTARAKQIAEETLTEVKQCIGLS